MKSSTFLAFAALGVNAFADNLIDNSGFEIPSTNSIYNWAGGRINQYNQYDVVGWSTTATDGLIEIWDDGAQGVDAFEGGYFAEINATQDATIYQEAFIEAGTSVDYLFAHRGRLGTDTLRFTVVDLGLDGVFNGFDLEGGVTNDDSLLVDRTSTATRDGWLVSYGNDVFTTLEESTFRFSYEAVTAAGGPSIGNFLDAFVTGESLTDDLPEGEGVTDALPPALASNWGEVSNAPGAPTPSLYALMGFAGLFVLKEKMRTKK